MAGRIERISYDESGGFGPALEPHQLAAVAEPYRPIKELAGGEPSGNFQDLESLLEQLGTTPIMELGNPLPLEKFMPRRRAGGCPAAHNDALVGSEID